MSDVQFSFPSGLPLTPRERQYEGSDEYMAMVYLQPIACIKACN